MNEKEKKTLSPRLENFVKGFFMVLFAIVLGINVGRIAKTFAFVPLYLFGAFYYFLIGLMGFHGLSRMFLGKKFRIHSVIINFGIVTAFIATYFLVSYFTNKAMNVDFSVSGWTDLEAYNARLSNFYSSKQILAFDPNSGWGSGLVGVLIGHLVKSNDIILGIAVVFIVLTVLLFAIKPLLALSKYLKEKQNNPQDKVRKEPKEKKERKPFFSFRNRKKNIEEEPEEEEKKYPDITPISIEPEPAQIEEPEFHAQFGFETYTNNDSSTDFEKNNLSLDDSYSSKIIRQNEFNEFSPLKFDGGVDDNPFKNVNNSSFENIDHQELRDTIDKLRIEKEKDEEENIEEVKEEQPSSNIEDEIENNDVNSEEEVEENIAEEEVIEERPTFEEAKEIVIEEQPQRVVQPVIEEKKVEVVEEVPPTPPAPPAPKKKERVEWFPPSSELLETIETTEALEANSKAAEERMVLINDILNNFKVGARCTSYTIGSSVTRFNIEYDANVSVKSVDKLVDDISLRLGGVNARFTPIVQGESFSGLEIPNVTITTVTFKEIFESLPPVNKKPLAVGFGKDISGKVIAAEFDEFPHLLVAGTTGSGKSIYIHSIIATLIMRVSPDDLKIVLVDPKKVEMTKYRDMPHLLCPIITEASKAKVMMSKLVDEMNDRYEKFALADSCSNIKQFNEYAREHNIDTMPYIIAVLDEYADLVDTCKEISQPVVSIAQKARAAGIHMLISTQRPSTNVITGVIKGNLPTHVALMTSSYTDSMTILGEGGAEKLLGKGDMLVQSPLVSRVGLTRLQGCFIQNKEIARIVGYLKEHYETVYDPNYLDLIDHSKEEGERMVASGEVEKEANNADEEKYQSIKEWVMTQEFVSMSKIQRECGVGFNRAGKIFSRLQREGVVSTQQDGATKGCKVLKHGDDDNYDDLIVTSDELIN